MTTSKFRGMEYREVTGNNSAIEEMVESSRWFAQQKMDGVRVMIHFTGTPHCLVTGRKGDPIKHAASVQHVSEVVAEMCATLPDFYKGCLFDGELIPSTGEYHVFDVLRPAPAYLADSGRPYYTSEPAGDRLSTLRSLGLLLELPVVDEARAERLAQGKRRRVYAVPSAETTGDKRALLSAVEARGAEGVVFKDRAGLYDNTTPRVSTVLKVKLTHTADLIVMEKSTSPSSVLLGYWPTVTDRDELLVKPFYPYVRVPDARYGDHHLISSEAPALSDDGVNQWVYRPGCLFATPVCRASLIGKEKDGSIEVGDIVEAAYLYRDPEGGGLVQPRILRKRWSLAWNRTNCGAQQFTPYTRERIAFA